jgi:hypothetical protein
LSKKDSVWVNDENGLICIAYQMEQDDYHVEKQKGTDPLLHQKSWQQIK